MHQHIAVCRLLWHLSSAETHTGILHDTLQHIPYCDLLHIVRDFGHTDPSDPSQIGVSESPAPGPAAANRFYRANKDRNNST